MRNLPWHEELGKLLVRLLVGALLLFHGIAKLANPGTVEQMGGLLTGAGLPAVLAYGVYIGEVVAPLMLITGLYTRAGGVIVAINMLFAIGLVHTGDIFLLSEHGGWRLELQGFYLFGGLAVALLGSGRYALQPD